MTSTQQLDEEFGIITLLTSERSGAVIHVIRVERALTGSNALFWAGSNGFML